MTPIPTREIIVSRGKDMNKLTAFFLSVLLLFGAFPAEISVKSQIGLAALSFPDTDITEGYTVSVPDRDGSIRFNRIGFSYAASAAVRAVIRYRMGLRTVEEELLLSAKDDQATLLLNGYLRRRTASCLLSVHFEPIIAGQKCTLRVSDFTCDIQTVPKNKTLYIENDRFKAGVNLKWGGGLCHFEDKRDSRYGNLLNCHDTGRLVQQSYYGPSKIEGYENGIYENTVWSYNPVQGGDQYGNCSKLVAVEKSDTQIRVICRPLDWALDNVLTQTYYTSVYTLTESGLDVRNTAVDFLQTEWPPFNSHEIPALYTISALGSFWYYDGDAPWTNAPLRVERDLPFWVNNNGMFNLKPGNSETWCAWTDDNDYGLGIFTPDATCLKAGRYMYDGSADPFGVSTNYVAPLAAFALHFDQPHTYQFTMTAGSLQEMRDTFQSSRVRQNDGA